MTPYPDNDDSARFAAAMGSPAYDRKLADAEASVAADVAQMKRLKDAAAVMRHELRLVQWDKEPDFDHDWEDGTAFVEELATRDVAAFEKARIEEAMEDE
jgi:hypothetical protein